MTNADGVELLYDEKIGLLKKATLPFTVLTIGGLIIALRDKGILTSDEIVEGMLLYEQTQGKETSHE